MPGRENGGFGLLTFWGFGLNASFELISPVIDFPIGFVQAQPGLGWQAPVATEAEGLFFLAKPITTARIELGSPFATLNSVGKYHRH